MDGETSQSTGLVAEHPLTTDYFLWLLQARLTTKHSDTSSDFVRPNGKP